MARRILQKEEYCLWQRFTEDVTPLSSPTKRDMQPPSSAWPEKISNPATPPYGGKKILPSPDKVERVGEMCVMANNHYRPSRTHHMPHKERPHMVGVRPAGLDNTQWTRLTKGKITVNAKLDLHGYTVQDAFEVFCAFMARARGRQWRCVEIVTGLGSGPRGGMIRQELPHWLQRAEIRSAVLSAVHTHAGNCGAIRILLRKY